MVIIEWLHYSNNWTTVVKLSLLVTTTSGFSVLTVGGERLTAEPRRSWGPMLEWRRVGSPEAPPGVPPGDEAHDGAMRIFGVMRVLSERRRFGNTFDTRRKLLSLLELLEPNSHPPRPVSAG